MEFTKNKEVRLTANVTLTSGKKLYVGDLARIKKALALQRSFVIMSDSGVKTILENNKLELV